MLEEKHHVSTTYVTNTFSVAHRLEDNLKRTNRHHGTIGARWQGGSWACIRRLSVPQRQESLCDVPLASISFGCGWCQCLCKTNRGETGDMGVRSKLLRNESAEKSFFFSSTGTLFLPHLCKVSSVSLFLFGDVRVDVRSKHVQQVSIFGRSALYNLTFVLLRCKQALSRVLTLICVPVLEPSDICFN